MNGLSHVIRQRITSVRFRGRSSKLRRSHDTKNEIATSLASIGSVHVPSDITGSKSELDFISRIDSLVSSSLESDTDLEKGGLKDLKDVEIRERINTDPILKSLNLDFGVDFNKLLAFHGDFDIENLAFDDYAERIHTLMEILNLESSNIGRIIERNPLILKNDDFNCIQRWKEITDFLSDGKTLTYHKHPAISVGPMIVRNPMILNKSVPQLRKTIAYFMVNDILNGKRYRGRISKALKEEPLLLTQPFAHFERVIKTLSMYGLAQDQLQNIFFQNAPAFSKRFFESFIEVDKHMSFLITECGLTPTIIAENPLVLTSDPYILKERCLFLQYYIENNGILDGLDDLDFARLKGKATKGSTIDPSVLGQMLHGDLLAPRIRDNKSPIAKKKDLEIFCSLLNIQVADYYRFIAKL